MAGTPNFFGTPKLTLNPLGNTPQLTVYASPGTASLTIYTGGANGSKIERIRANQQASTWPQLGPIAYGLFVLYLGGAPYEELPFGFKHIADFKFDGHQYEELYLPSGQTLAIACALSVAGAPNIWIETFALDA